MAAESSFWVFDGIPLMSDQLPLYDLRSYRPHGSGNERRTNMTTTTADLSASGLTAAYTQDIESKLAAIRSRIDEIQSELPGLMEAEEFLRNLLTNVGAGASTLGTVPKARTASDIGATVPVDEAPPAAVPPKQRRKPSAAKEEASKPPRRSRKQSAPTADAPAPSVDSQSLSLRVLTYLRGQSGPQTAREIAEALFGQSPDPSTVNKTRAAAATLVKRRDAEKSAQGNAVFYQAGTSATSAASEQESAEQS